MTPFGGGGKRHLTIPGYASGVRRRMLATAPRQWVENTTGHRSPPIHRRGEKIRPSGLYVPTASPLRLFYWCFKVLPDLLGQIWDTGHGNDHEAGRIAVAGEGETDGLPHAGSPPLLPRGGRGGGAGRRKFGVWETAVRPTRTHSARCSDGIRGRSRPPKSRPTSSRSRLMSS